MTKTILVALGGNAIKSADDEGTAAEQFANVYKASAELVKLIKAGYKLVVTHGNGPQAGNLLIQQEEGKKFVPDMPLDVVGAMTQGQLGYMFAQALGNLLRKEGIETPVAALVNQVLVSADDPDYLDPSKPVGPFFTEAEAAQLKIDKPDWLIKEVKPKTVEKRFRRVVASPKPKANVESDVIRRMIDAGIIVIASGGGGVPVIEGANGLEGTAAVIDKDIAGAKLAEIIGADVLLILTDVAHAKLNYGKPNETNVGTVSLSEMHTLAEGGDFLAGSMGPKVRACMKFVEKGGARAIITSLDHAYDAITGNFGTQIVQ
ncbi:MAG: carbamate kinase [Proteobacteria bacterium]|nr:carbamate kinase [Pseudomonadota bacterium]